VHDCALLPPPPPPPSIHAAEYGCVGAQETAINIGFAARMLTNEFVRILVSSEELFSDRMQEDAAKERKEEETRAGKAAADTGRAALPYIAPAILDINTRVKLRRYANISRAKADLGQEFARPRGLIVDEPVMNLVWPSIGKLPGVTPVTVRDCYKEVSVLLNRVHSLCAVTADTAYINYTDGQWADSEGSVLAGWRSATLEAADAALSSKVASIWAKHSLPARREELQARLDEGFGPLWSDIHLDRVPRDNPDLVAAVKAYGELLHQVHGACRQILHAMSPSMQDDLLVIAESCKSVIACRCRPDQKKKMLELIRYRVPTSRCLAVGDGANDVDMIQAANVGVGIIGPEGVQAANASDYAIGRFRFLARLLLAHGRWNYTRMALLICYMFYKNVLYAFAQMIYTVVAAWSGQKFYVEAASQTFNLVYTGLPILVAAVYDKDVSADNALKFPYLYSDGLFRRRLNLGLLLWWLATAVYEATLLFVFAYWGSFYASDRGTTPYVFEFGTWIFTALVVLVNLRLSLNVWLHNWLYVLAIFLSTAIWWPAAYVFDALNSDNMEGGMNFLFASGQFWLWLLLVTVASQVHVFAIMMGKRMFAPEYRDLVNEYEVLATPAGTAPNWYQRALTLCQRRRRTRQERDAQTKLDKVEAALPRRGELTDRPLAGPAVGAGASHPAVTAGAGGGQLMLSPTAATPLVGAEAPSATAALPSSPPHRADAVAAAGEPQDVPFGPDLAHLLSYRNPTLRCGAVGDQYTVWTAEELQESLIEWPVEESMRVSLAMKYTQALAEAGGNRERAMQAVRLAKLELLKVRLSNVVEQETLARAHAREGEVILEATASPLASPGPGAAGGSGISTAAIAPAPAPVPAAAPVPAPAPTPAPAPSVSGGAGAAARTLLHASASAPTMPPPAPSESYVRMTRAVKTVSHGTGFDFSADDRHNAAYSNSLATVGRRASVRVATEVPGHSRHATAPTLASGTGLPSQTGPTHRPAASHGGAIAAAPAPRAAAALPTLPEASELTVQEVAL